jgi:hypothetical protein
MEGLDLVGELISAIRQVRGDIDGYLEGDWDGNHDGWQALSDRLSTALDAAGED